MMAVLLIRSIFSVRLQLVPKNSANSIASQTIYNGVVVLSHFEPFQLIVNWEYFDIHLSEKNEQQLNSTNHPPKWVAYKGKKLKQLIRIPDPWSESNFLFKISTLLQRNNAADRLFHASKNLTEKKYLRISKWTKWTCGLYTLSSWPLSSVSAITKKSLCWTLSRPLKILKTWLRSPLSLLVSNVVIFNLLNLSLYDKFLSLIISRVALFGTFSSKSISFCK